MKPMRPMVLLILDGWGVREQSKDNAIAQANPPNFSRWWREFPHTTLSASGEDVGLPKGQMGNSEVGHLNIGAGRVVLQLSMKISKSIEDGAFFKKPAFNKAVDRALENDAAVHLIGLVSDGGVHSLLEHLYAVLELCRRKEQKRVFIHGLLDGRDVGPKTAEIYIRTVERRCEEIGVGRFASIAGRWWTMDRDKRWERVRRGYRCLMAAEEYEGPFNDAAVQAVAEGYRRGETDEFIQPARIKGAEFIRPEDSVICFNFRPDRMRQITRALADPAFDAFPRKTEPDSKGRPRLPGVYAMTLYDENFQLPHAFPPHEEKIEGTLSEAVAAAGLKQLHLAETEKYAHVTYFLNGGVETPVTGEERAMVPSPKVKTYDLKPEMSAPEVCAKAVEKITSGNFAVVVINFANADMVGHTGIFDAARKAVETVDRCAGKIVETALKKGGGCLLTADHGNAEIMRDTEGNPHTAHTISPVPCILIYDPKNPASEEFAGAPLRSGGRLADLAPTVLDLAGIPKPKQMTGRSLLTHG